MVTNGPTFNRQYNMYGQFTVSITPAHERYMSIKVTVSRSFGCITNWNAIDAILQNVLHEREILEGRNEQLSIHV